MGKPGPKPLPANVHMLRGNPSKKSFSDLQGELQPEVEMPTAPSWIWPEAKKEWNRLKPELLKHGLTAKQYRSALVLHCQAWAEYVFHKQELDKDREAAIKEKAATEAAGEKYNGGDGIMIKTANGNFTYSHHWVCANKAHQQVKDTLNLFGLAPCYLAGVTASDNRQSGLFDEPASQDKWNSL